MSGYQKNKERLEAIDALGRTLARRAKSTCEVSGESGVSLQPYEVPPLPEDPTLDTTILISESVADLLAEREKKGVLKVDAESAKELRYLENAIWSEVPAVKIVACRLLGSLEIPGQSWPRDTLDMVYLDEEEQAWLDNE